MSKNSNKEDKYKNLFENTADEIFYDFIKKHNKKIFLLIISIILSIIYFTHEYANNNKLNLEIADSIHVLIDKVKNNENCNQIIDKVIIKTKTSKLSDTFNLDQNKIAYRSTLLLLKNTDIMNSKEWTEYLQYVENLPYVCQYVHTVAHGDRYILSAELLFFKVIQEMKKRNYSEKDILTFVMKKKLHASILGSYVYIYLSSQFNNNYMLSDLISMYNTSIHNIDILFLTLINNDKNSKSEEK